MTADPHAGTPYEGSREGWWTKYGGARNPSLASSTSRRGLTSRRARTRARTAAGRGSSYRKGGAVGKPQIERPTDPDDQGDREWSPGTLRDNVLDVHWMRMNPVEVRCGLDIPQDTGRREVYRWQRLVNCLGCLAATD